MLIQGVADICYTEYQGNEMVFACDAWSYGIGTVISHIMEDSEEKPIAHTFCTLTTAEKTMHKLIKKVLR